MFIPVAQFEVFGTSTIFGVSLEPTKVVTNRTTRSILVTVPSVSIVSTVSVVIR